MLKCDIIAKFSTFETLFWKYIRFCVRICEKHSFVKYTLFKCHKLQNFIGILSTSNRIPTKGAVAKKSSHVYFLLIVAMVLLLWCQIVLLWHQATMVAAEQHTYLRIVLPKKLATGSMHNYLFCYCPQWVFYLRYWELDISYIAPPPQLLFTSKYHTLFIITMYIHSYAANDALWLSQIIFFIINFFIICLYIILFEAWH